MRSLLDTNILVYADSSDEPVKQRRAIGLIRDLRLDGSAGVASGCSRVLSEELQQGAQWGGAG